MLVVMSASPVHGQTTTFTYQGQLSDAGALANGSYDLRFALFDAAAGGAQIGANQDVPAVPVSAGVFTVQLDFGVNAFPGANRFLEIGVKPAGGGSFTTLAPGQQISSSPYAIRTLSAATADALSSACVGCVKDTQIQAVAGSKVSGTIPAASVPAGSGNYLQNTTAQQPNSNFNISGNGVVGGNLTVAGTLNANVSGNFIQNRTTPQAGANFNVGGTGTVGGVLSAGSVGVGTASPGAGLAVEVNGATKLTTGGSGGDIIFGTPNAETGMSIRGANNRADLRFDASTLKLVAGVGTGPPASSSGVAITTAGSVGIGTTDPTTGRLHVVGAVNVPAIYGESPNRGVWGHSTGSSRGVYGDSSSGEGVHGESTSGAGVVGVSTSSVGVAGVSTGGAGVQGFSSATDIARPGVYGISAGNGGVGVRGDANASDGKGVYGASTGSIGYGVFATNLSGGMAIGAAGDAAQNRDKGGFVKAMIHVNADGTINRCYNSQLIGNAAFTGLPLASTVPCGFAVTTGNGDYIVDFQFRVDDRFYSLTLYNDQLIAGTVYGNEICGNCATVNQLYVLIAGQQTSRFTLIVY
jgi:hypothetical protein